MKPVLRLPDTSSVESDRPSYNPVFLEALAWTESTSEEDLRYLVDYLKTQGWIEERPSHPNYRVTIDGYERVAEKEAEVDSSQAFVAMWFDDSMLDAYEYGIESGIKDSGYSPFRIDRKEHINKIDDEIIAEIRRSRFVVADFTHGKDGARGSVYYEAGFAHGLGIPVIFTCRQDSLKNLHFDTEHYTHIVWSRSGELREKLKTRILAVIGEGPEVNSSS